MPVCRGELPGQMISELQGVTWETGEAWRAKNSSKLSMEKFGRELNDLLKTQPGGLSNSRRHAIDVITQIIKEI
jgi:hypothetical protein